MKVTPDGSERRNHPALWLCLALLPLLASCAAPAMRDQFINYNGAYATSLNKQMLLNLARLANGQPAYYLAIGEIDNRYTFSSQTGAGVNGSYQNTSTATGNSPFVSGTPSSIAGFPLAVAQKVVQTVIGGNASETVQASSSPEFIFIPINNEETAKQVLQPLDPEVFLSLYQQGYPIDQLMRIMIERIDAPNLPDDTHLVLVNSPITPDPEYYERFLRVCALLRVMQMNGYLWLDAQPEYRQLGQVSFSSGKSASDPTNQQHSGGAAGGGVDSNPSPSDFMEAKNNNINLVYTNFTVSIAGEGTNANSHQEAGWMAYEKEAVPKFYLRYEYEPDPAQQEALKNLRADLEGNNTNLSADDLKEKQAQMISLLLTNATSVITFLETNKYALINNKDNDDAVTNLISALCQGVSIQTDVGQGDPGTTRLVLRSFNRTMESVATEQAGFEALKTNDIAHFTMRIPSFEQRPVLQMLWTNSPSSLAPPTESISYENKEYRITDLVTDPLDSTATWNRDTFRLLVGLNSLVTVDISKFQRQVLELEQ
jgi:hypothetical protein